MFGEILRFDLRYRLRQPTVYLFGAMFFLLAFLTIASDITRQGDAGNVAVNSPYTIIRLLASFGLVGLLAVTVFTASSVNRDRELATQELFFSTPLKRGAYLGGRFAASVILAIFAIAAAVPGIVISALMPWQDPDHLVAFRIMPYIIAFAVFLLPSLLAVGAIVFSAAALTQRRLFAYVAMIALICLWGISKAFAADLDSRLWAALTDPFGVSTFKLATRYWTVAERHTLLLPSSGYLALNRLVWMGIGATCLMLTVHRFRLTLGIRAVRSERSAPKPDSRAASAERYSTTGAMLTVPDVLPTFTARSVFTQWIRQARVEVTAVLRSAAFIVIMILAVAYLVAQLSRTTEGASTYPLTRLMLDRFYDGFYLFLVIITVIFGAELVWRERRAGVSELFDALPVPNWLFLTAKLTAVVVILAVSLLVATVTELLYQAANGYFEFEIALYLRHVTLVFLPEWVLLAALALFAHVLANRRSLAYLLILAYLLAVENLPLLGFDHHLYLYGTAPSATYSDMNGYGHFVAPLFWFRLHWGLAAVGLLLLADLLWARGTDNRLRLRLRQLGNGLTRRRVSALAIVGLAFAATGGWIFYNTNILNHYKPDHDATQLQVLYEERYQQYEDLPQPRVTDIALDIALYPESRRVDLHGELRLANKTGRTIDQLHVLLDADLDINNFIVPGADLELDDRQIGYRIYRLAESLAPGDPLDVQYNLSINQRGFVNGDSDVRLVANGTFFSESDYFPQFGYQPGLELEDPDEREKHGLPPQSRMPATDDAAARQIGRTRDADYITFEATISTSLDQIALAPGYLQREWTEGDRRHFHYRMDAPILKSFGIVSGRYEIARDHWNDVAIEIYYHKPHHFNVDRMIEAIKKSLDYYTTNFSPYQYRQVRIVEFPCYRRFAQSFPNTIPYSESMHFVDDLRDPDDIDMVFYITAHEVAHQWWGHQVRGAAVRGATMLLESMAQYSALMVMEKEYGRDQMKKFLAYELDRYLSGRAQERRKEMPLMHVEYQRYIHYNKGSLAMYALREYIGEESLNAALREFIRDYAFQGPPYPTTPEFLAYIREATPTHLQYLVEDLFETITLYDNRAEQVTATRTDDGKYRVRLAYQSRKLRSAGQGVETEINHADWIEIGVFGWGLADDQPGANTLYLEKHRLKSGSNRIEIVVDHEPVLAGIDPRNLLIDRRPNDNTKQVVMK